MKLFDLDKIGICLSSACAIHCSVMPLVLLYSSTLGIFSFIDSPVVELIILIATTLIGGLALIPSTIKYGQAYVLILFISGILIVINSEMTSALWSRILLSIAGGLLMAYAHFENLKIKKAHS
ncbi:MAG: hypothetical protein CMB80_06255 [Flammeovirgaceae bacterium]|nr:hypothetical protein [Flammeovirgaceae bacterium]MBR09595.1 hypothetical protein [Rickettsiales bacterium]HCX21647.1 hypothetical protein [Cytophagales bacterium]|tara:strand:+ start:2012 stop:2380 length:369 start_codon:yes stop_codon:yes gene_type:complete